MTDKKIVSYARAACNLYGIIHLRNLIQILKHYENESFTRTQLDVVMQKNISEHMIISYKNGFLFQKDVFEYLEDGIEMYKSEEQKPYYLPEKKEFLKYVSSCYYEKTTYTEKLSLYLHKKAKRSEYSYIGIDEYLKITMEQVMLAIQSNHDMATVMQSLLEFDIDINNQEELQEFGDILMEVFNHTRMIINHGHTPYELKDLYQAKKTRLMN